MTEPIPCSYCGTPGPVDSHPACRPAAPARRIGAMPAWWYHRGIDPVSVGRMWAHLAELEAERVADFAAAWALERELDEKAKAAWIVAAGDAALRRVEAERQAQPDLDEHRALVRRVVEERQLLAAHRSPDGWPYEGLMA